MSVSSAKKQKISRAMKWFMSWRRCGGSPFGVFLQQLDIEPVQAAGGPDVEGAFADLLDGGDAGQRQEEAEMVREVGIGAGDRLAGVRSSASNSSPSVARMNFAFALAVAGLAFSAARVFVTSPVRRRRYGCCWSEGRRPGRTCSIRPCAAA